MVMQVSLNPSAIIRDKREGLGISLDQAAASMGLSTPRYRDLEDYDDELFTAVALIEMIRLCQLLQLSPRYVLSCEPTLPIRQPEELKHLIFSHCRNTSTPIEKFEEQVGWEIKRFLADPQSEFQKWNLDCLLDVCLAVGASYKEFIPK